MNSQVAYLDEKTRRVSLLFSCALHGILILAVIFLGRSVRVIVPATPVYVAHLLELPRFPEVRTPLPIPAPPEQTFSPSRTADLLRRRISPTLKRETPRPVPRRETPSFAADAFKRELTGKLGGYEPLTDRNISSPAPSRNTFSSQDYRRQLESRLSPTSRPPQEKQPTVTLPETPRLKTDSMNLAVPLIVGSEQQVPSWYLALIKKRIEENWRVSRPQSLAEDTAIVSFRISDRGTISEPVLEKLGQTGDFSRSALDAVRRSNPLPALPPEVKEKTLEVSVEFTARGIR